MSGPHVYDKAKYHYGGEYPEGLSTDQAFVHTGLFFGWILENALYSEEFQEDSEEEIAAFKQKKMTGTEVYKTWDGALVDDMLNEEGNRFAIDYFEFETGEYLKDYEKIFPGLPSFYHVQDTWENYEKIKTVIDQRYHEWKNK